MGMGESLCSWVYPHFTLLSQGYGLVSVVGKKGDGEMSISPGVPVQRGGEESFKEGKDQTREDLGHLILGQWLWLEENGIKNVGKMRKDGNMTEGRRATS